MAKLSSDHKRYIVKRLACFAAHTEIQAEMKERFQVIPSLPQIAYYDPAASPDLAQDWRDLHQSTRAAFLVDEQGVAITHQLWRLRELEDMARRAKASRNYKLAASLLEQAAKERGGAFTTQHRANPAATETDEQRAASIRALLDAMDDVTTSPQTPPAPPTLTVVNGQAVA